MKLRVYVDESGRPCPVKPSAKRRQRLFVIAALALNEHNVQGLLNAYRDLLASPIEGAKGSFTLGELFDIYRRVTGKKPEVKAGWIVNCQGPFAVLHNAPREIRLRLLVDVMNTALRAIVNHAWRLYIVVIDKPRAYAIAPRVRERSGLQFNLRVFALDFLLTRLAKLVMQGVAREVEIIHDDVSDKQLILDYFTRAARRGYIYNPRVRVRPEAFRRTTIIFQDSIENPLLQYADLVAYAARALRSGTVPPNEEAIYRQYFYVQRNNSKVVWIEYT